MKPSRINFKYSTRDCWGKLRYFTKTIDDVLPTDAHGFILMDDCCKLARNAVKGVKNFNDLLWVRLV